MAVFPRLLTGRHDRGASGIPDRQRLPLCYPEDEAGFLNIIVRPDVYVRYRKVLRGTAFILVEGLIERQGLVTNVVAREIRPINAITMN